MHANNEIGTIQPVAELARIAHAHGALVPHRRRPVGRQDPGRRPARSASTCCRLSAHKFNGPKGAGALWIKRGTRVAAILTGGKHERNRRAGTENVPAIAGLGVAATAGCHEADEVQGRRLAALRDRLEQRSARAACRARRSTAPATRASRTRRTSASKAIEAESLLIALDLEGVAVSTGSACSSGTLEPSHVLRAMGLPTHRTQNSIRISLGAGNTDARGRSTSLGKLAGRGRETAHEA